MKLLRLLPIVFACVALVHADDGYRLWLRYDRITHDAYRTATLAATQRVVLVTPTGVESPTIAAARDELTRGLGGLLGAAPNLVVKKAPAPAPAGLGTEGYTLRSAPGSVSISAPSDVGALYGAFRLLREIQLGHDVSHLDLSSAPKINHRLLSHWDNLNRTVERGYAGFSLWEWFVLPDYLSPRYRDYARACASIGINGSVLNNVNADPLILTPTWLRKVAALADVFRPYGIHVYLAVRFSAPVEIGGLKTADPFDPTVKAWWRNEVDEIYRLIPDFGGFVVKANSEGQPGPQTYGRTHADGANLLADALAPHGGIVMWRAFVYDAKNPEDRCKQAYSEFQPLDGKFRDNVVIQIKNGPLDFQPREPFHPLFGAMPRTNLGLEVQITQEYLGNGTCLAFLAPMWREVLDSDTYRPGPGATVGRIVDGSVNHNPISLMVGVANTGTDRDWTGHPLAQANWYAFGRLAWNHDVSSAEIASEWTRMTFGPNPDIARKLVPMLLESRETVVDYEMPLGLHHIMSTGNHYGPGPWVDNLSRADWNPVYYNRADAKGLGFDRTATGSNALSQYAPQAAAKWADLATCPDRFLLWFHHVPWGHRMSSGRTLWDELCLHYQHGVDNVRSWQKTWASMKGEIDPETFNHVSSLLKIQERDACWWRDACLLYFQTFSHRPLPAGVEPPKHDLAYFEALQIHWAPGNPGEL